MTFSFGFGGGDIEKDEGSDIENEIRDNTNKDAQQTIAPKAWSLRELVSLLPSQISYNKLVIASEGSNVSHNVSIPRRSLYDIRAQLMAEANSDENDNHILLDNLDAGDLTSGQYEGGFKTWECAVDLAEEVSKLRLEGRWHIIELGAGSAMPALALLQTALKGSSAAQSIRFTLCDYNEDVLKLCTMPNVLLSCLVGCSCEDKEDVDDWDHDIDLEAVSPYLIGDLEQQLRQRGITVHFVSGPWGDDFVDLVRGHAVDEDTESVLILASETIYSPESIEAFTNTVIKLLAGRKARACVAAKNVYFGVGGGTPEFTRAVRKAGGFLRVLQENVGGVGRTILEVTHP